MRRELKALRLGARTVDLHLEGGRIARIAPTRTAARRTVLPLLTDAHVHLDKTYTAHRTGAHGGGLAAALERAEADKAHWTAEDIRSRAGRALARAEANGIGALRTHVDWDGPSPPAAWDIIAELAEDWRGRVAVGRASLTGLDILADADHGPGIARRVAKTGGTLGAFVYRNAHLPSKLEAVFALALKHDLALDFHVDEGLDRDARGLDTIVALTHRHHLAGRVLAGHACALSVRPEADAARLLEAAAEAGVALAVLPTTNTWLQDARPGRTPRFRGLAPVQEAGAAGIDVAIALDNVQDAFYPFGDYDLLDAWRLAVLNAQLDPDAWAEAITTAPARITGLATPALVEGCPADFLVIDAPSLAAYVSSPRAPRSVWRGGQPRPA